MKTSKDIQQIEMKPMSDADIRSYLGKNVKIIEYKDLKKYNSIDELLPNDRDYCVLLYEDQPNSGHWTALLKYDNNIELFDSYSNTDIKILHWTPFRIRQMLGEDDDYLTKLVEKSKYNFIHNTCRYQGNDTETCGRHVVLRILAFLQDNADLPQNNQMMMVLKKKYPTLNMDEIVSSLITK
jgi:hypothetical protein